MSQPQTFKPINYRFIIIGVIMIIIGYLLMIGGGSEDPNIFNPEIFSFRRIVLSPVIIVAGLLIIIVGIMKKFGKE